LGINGWIVGSWNSKVGQIWFGSSVFGISGQSWKAMAQTSRVGTSMV
jgi:hypothetical protein